MRSLTAVPPMDELACLLGHELRRLELLLFKVVEGRHLLAAGEARFLPYAAAEVDRAVERLQEAELRRSMLVHRLAGELDVPEEALTMSTLAEDSVEPYRTIFSDHRRAFLELAAEIRLASGYQAALGATARLKMPSLVDWLQ